MRRHRDINPMSYWEVIFSRQERLLVVLCGAIAAAILGGVIYNVLMDFEVLKQKSSWIAIAIAFALLLISYAINVWANRRVTKELNTRIARYEARPVENIVTHSARGLIWLFSHLNYEHALQIIEKHTFGISQGEIRSQRGRLEVCWCIITQEPSISDIVQQAYSKFREEIANPTSSGTISDYVEIVEIPVPHADVESVYDAVNKIYTEGIQQYNIAHPKQKPLQERDVVADITSGLRSMAVGMLLACLQENRLVECARAEYRTDGKIQENMDHLILINTSNIWHKTQFDIIRLLSDKQG